MYKKYLLDDGFVINGSGLHTAQYKKFLPLLLLIFTANDGEIQSSKGEYSNNLSFFTKFIRVRVICIMIIFDLSVY